MAATTLEPCQGDGEDGDKADDAYAHHVDNDDATAGKLTTYADRLAHIVLGVAVSVEVDAGVVVDVAITTMPHDLPIISSMRD